MKVNKMKLMATIGALGLTAGVLGACGQSNDDDDDYVKVVDSEGKTVYVDEDEFEESGGSNGGFFMLYSNWNGQNHSKLKPSTSFKGKTFTSKPKVSSGGFGSKSSSGKSGGFGG